MEPHCCLQPSCGHSVLPNRHKLSEQSWNLGVGTHQVLSSYDLCQAAGAARGGSCRKTPNFFLFQGMFTCFPAQQEQQGFQVSHRAGWVPSLCHGWKATQNCSERVGWTLHSIRPRERDVCTHALPCAAALTQHRLQKQSSFLLFFSPSPHSYF